MQNHTRRARNFICALAILIILLLPAYAQVSSVAAQSDLPAGGNPSMAFTLPAPLITEVNVKSKEVVLGWNTIVGALRYNIYRSLTSGSGYMLVGQAPSFSTTLITRYVDQNLTNGTRYYYAVTSVDNLGVESWYSNEILVIPHLPIEWAGTILPSELTIQVATGASVDPIYGEIYIDSNTGPQGPATQIGLIAQLGYGPAGTAPASWTNWINATYASQGIFQEANDRYRAQIILPRPGYYHYVYRFSLTGGYDWTYADRFSIIADPTVPVPDLPDDLNDGPGKLLIQASDDNIPPAAPTGLTAGTPQFRSVPLSWTGVGDEDLFGYEVFRSKLVAGPFESVGMALAPATTFNDTNAVAGTTYYYQVRAFDFNYNASGPSNTVTATTPQRAVSVTVKAAVPAFTPGAVSFSLCRDFSNMTCHEWDSTSIAMTNTGGYWTAALPPVQDGTPLIFYFHRGSSQLTGQAQADGNSPLQYNPVIADYGTNGIQEIIRIVVNWRDPIVVHYTPPSVGKVSPAAPITVTWNQPMPENTTFIVRDSLGQPIAGHFSYHAGNYRVTFIPNQAIPIDSTYSVEVSGVTDLVGDVQQVPVTWTVTTGAFSIWVPVIYSNSP